MSDGSPVQVAVAVSRPRLYDAWRGQPGLCMATLDQVRGLLDAGYSYEAIGAQLEIAPGLAYMIATGVAADGSGDPTPEPARAAAQPGAQRLAQPVARSPTRKPHVVEWIRHRAQTDLRDDA